MAEPLAEADHGTQHVDDVVVDVAAFDRAAKVETTPRLASAASGRRRGGKIVPEDGSRPAAAPVSSKGAVREVTLAVDPLEDLIDKDIRRMEAIQKVRGSEQLPCIWRVPPSIREQESEAYEPKLVSIGPLHRGKKSLLPMEEIKLSYLSNLLSRSRDRNKLSNYIRVIRDCEARARTQYAEEVELTEDEFVRMLVVDGCFIIEFFLKRVFKEAQETAQLSRVRWGFSHLRRDLMLLENQIPFFVLVKLFDQSTIPFRGTRQDHLTLMEIALKFLEIELPGERKPHVDQVHHLLHLYHICLNPSRIPEEPCCRSCAHLALHPFKKAASLTSVLFFALLYLLLIHKWPGRFYRTHESEVPRMIPCATELYKAGVKFKKKDWANRCYLKVSFTEGTLEIPVLPVQETTSSKLRNFIALEQSCPQVGSHFTSYAIFMECIIDTEGDVAILRSHRIIESKLGSYAEVAKMFNTLCKGVHLNYKEHYNAPLFRDVNEYCEVPHNRWRASLKGKYFGNPWSIISLLAGIVLILFAAIQAYFTAYPRR